MVTQGGYAQSSSKNLSANETKELSDLMIQSFQSGVGWFAIYSCILGVVMLTGTYLSIVLFNTAAQSQVRRCTTTFLKELCCQGQSTTEYSFIDFQNSRQVSSICAKSGHIVV